MTETGPRFSRDGRQVLFSSKAKTASAYDLAVMDWATRKVRNLTNEPTRNHLWEDGGFSPDGSAVHASRFDAGFTDADLYRIDAKTLAMENLTAHQGNLRFQFADVSPDGPTRRR